MADCSLLMTSSPGFVREYFAHYHHDLPPTAVVENKMLISELDPADVLAVRAGAFSTRPGPPWVIGWFGLLRCRRSLHVLAELCRAHPDLVRVEIRGRPAVTVGDELTKVAAITPGMTFEGPYQRADLRRLYSRVHFCWTPDYSESGANSDWLLPNRLYEAGAFGCVPLAMRSVETGRWLDEHGVGVLLDEPAGSTLATYLADLTPDAYAATRAAFLALPPSTFVDGEDDAEALVRQLFSAGLR
jgi:succinoglycan biosynthesis protein ExoL